MFHYINYINKYVHTHTVNKKCFSELRSQQVIALLAELMGRIHDMNIMLSNVNIKHYSTTISRGSCFSFQKLVKKIRVRL